MQIYRNNEDNKVAQKQLTRMLNEAELNWQ